MSMDFTVATLGGSSFSTKWLIQAMYSKGGMHLAAEIAHDTTTGEAPMKSILDPSFRYTKSVDTDLRKTFARIRRQQRQQAQPQGAGEDLRNVFPLVHGKRVAVS